LSEIRWAVSQFLEAAAGTADDPSMRSASPPTGPGSRSASIVILFMAAASGVGCATGPTAPKGIEPRAHLTPVDYYPLTPGWKWAYDVEKDDVNILATYAVVERNGDTALVQAGDERLAYAVLSDGVAQKDGRSLGDYVIKGPIAVGTEWPVAGGKARISAVGADFVMGSGERYLGCVVVEATRTEPMRVTRTTFAPDVGPVEIDLQVLEGDKFTTLTRARLRALTRPDAP
jgi:hypothetical protein